MSGATVCICKVFCTGRLDSLGFTCPIFPRDPSTTLVSVLTVDPVDVLVAVFPIDPVVTCGSTVFDLSIPLANLDPKDALVPTAELKTDFPMAVLATSCSLPV